MIITQAKLKSIRKKEKTIAFASGIFDIPHAGHALFLKDCKRYGTTVIGVGSDKDVKQFKYDSGSLMNEHIRMFMVDSIKGVDYTILTDSNYGEGDKVNSALAPILYKLKPDYWIVNDDSPFMETKKQVCKELEIKLIILKRKCPKEFEKISTSKIVKQIKIKRKNEKSKYIIKKNITN